MRDTERHWYEHFLHMLLVPETEEHSTSLEETEIDPEQVEELLNDAQGG